MHNVTPFISVTFNSNKVRLSSEYLAPIINRLHDPKLDTPVECAFQCKDQGYVDDFENHVIGDYSFFGSKEFIQLINYN